MRAGFSPFSALKQPLPRISAAQVEAKNSAAAAMVWDNTNKVCSNVMTGIDFRLLTSVAYSSNNLQSKVLYASACFTTGTWKWADPTDTTIAQAFPVTFSASFVPKTPTGRVSAEKPMPPLYVPISQDIWYPFVKS